VESHIANHQYFMQRAIQLAARGLGRTSPNPVVGAVLVKNKRVVGEGYHQQAGGPHAEILALRQAGEQARGATMYVSLEPCCHHGKTPPCVPEIVAAGVSNVVVGLVDPDPRVSGGGIKQLREAGVSVELADEDSQEQCAEINRAFICRLKRGRPYITLKFASSLDGKIASRTGRSKYISGEEARRWVHRERNAHDAIMVGINTIRLDDPELTAREPEGRTPIKIVVDAAGRLPENAKIFQQAENGVLLLTTPRGQQAVKPRDGLDLIVTEDENGQVDLPLALRLLAERGINSILLEGGSRLNGSMLDRGLIDRVAGFVAPILVGGQEAVSPIGGFGVDCVGDALRLREVGWSTLGPDLLIEGFLWMPSDEIQVPIIEEETPAGD
jgi:diaminohydroxyphosphoribosylaminopyrimidine deaminase/5-amino-6-(5-phosphoribosylamino)uracil reductase